MPRGFLVKRYPNQFSTDSSQTSQSVDHSSCLALPLTTRPLIYRYSDEDRSDSSSSEAEAVSLNSIPSPLAISRSSVHSLASLALSPPLLSYSGKQYSQTELPQEVPLALTKSSFASQRKSPVTPHEDESPSALDLRCPGFIFHFPDRMPASAPNAYQRNIAALVNRSDNKTNTSLTTSKKRHSIESQKSLKRHKVIRKLNFDEHKSSPVSGTFIRDSDSEDDFTNSSCVRRSGDIDPSLNVVVITDEARAEIEKIDNKIGDYICALCKDKFNDAFGLAQHRCTRIVHVEYRCPECDKVFNCPANLASHRRWHKPRTNGTNGTQNGNNKKSKVSVVGTATIHPEANSNASNCSVDTNSSLASDETKAQSQESMDGKYECDLCRKRFRRSAYLKKHLLSLHNIDIENNKPSESSEQKNLSFNALKRKQKMFDFSHSIDNTINNEKDLVGNDFKYRCLVCSVVLNNEIALELHNKSVHSNHSLNCKYCQNLFFTETDLSIHINEFHSNTTTDSILKSVRPLIKQEFT